MILYKTIYVPALTIGSESQTTSGSVELVFNVMNDILQKLYNENQFFLTAEDFNINTLVVTHNSKYFRNLLQMYGLELLAREVMRITDT